MKKVIALIMAVMICVFCFTGCTFSAASNVNHNLSQAADNFQCLRKITVYNARTDLIVMENEAYCGHPDGLNDILRPNDFCSYGERREGE